MKWSGARSLHTHVLDEQMMVCIVLDEQMMVCIVLDEQIMVCIV